MKKRLLVSIAIVGMLVTGLLGVARAQTANGPGCEARLTVFNAIDFLGLYASLYDVSREQVVETVGGLNGDSLATCIIGLQRALIDGTEWAPEAKGAEETVETEEAGETAEDAWEAEVFDPDDDFETPSFSSQTCLTCLRIEMEDLDCGSSMSISVKSSSSGGDGSSNQQSVSQSVAAVSCSSSSSGAGP
jgi:hypothetical protein